MTSATVVGPPDLGPGTLADGDAAIEQALHPPSFTTDPYPVYARLRDEAPVYWSPYFGQWLVARGELVVEVARQWEIFSSVGWDSFFMSQLPEDLRPEIPTVIDHFRTVNISTTDPPVHTRLRRLLSKAFTPRRIATLEGRVRAVTGRLLDDVCEGGGDGGPGEPAGDNWAGRNSDGRQRDSRNGESRHGDGRQGDSRHGDGHPGQGAAGQVSFDLIAGLAYPLPVAMIGELYGVGESDHADLKRWSKAVVAYTGSSVAHPHLARELDTALAEFRAYLRGLVAERRQRPRDDLLSDLVAAVDEGERLAEDELMATSINLLFAGHETTTNLIGNGTLALLRHPDQLDLLRRRPELLPGAVEELLRYDSPVQRVRRITTCDINIGGREIPKGTPVTAFLGSANRDPADWDRPDELDVTRPDVFPMSFGGGPHYCIGAALARLEGRIAFEMLLERFAELTLADGFENRWHPNVAFRGLVELPLRGVLAG
ncbi:MAG: cytochrome P450 [Acidimicrobiia bacterium]|nr:cytochrome P450 [Acidimicrobiia bacterium]